MDGLDSTSLPNLAKQPKVFNTIVFSPSAANAARKRYCLLYTFLIFIYLLFSRSLLLLIINFKFFLCRNTASVSSQNVTSNSITLNQSKIVKTTAQVFRPPATINEITRYKLSVYK